MTRFSWWEGAGPRPRFGGTSAFIIIQRLCERKWKVCKLLIFKSVFFVFCKFFSRDKRFTRWAT